MQCTKTFLVLISVSSNKGPDEPVQMCIFPNAYTARINTLWMHQYDQLKGLPICDKYQNLMCLSKCSLKPFINYNKIVQQSFFI